MIRGKKGATGPYLGSCAGSPIQSTDEIVQPSGMPPEVG